MYTSTVATAVAERLAALVADAAMAIELPGGSTIRVTGLAALAPGLGLGLAAGRLVLRKS